MGSTMNHNNKIIKNNIPPSIVLYGGTGHAMQVRTIIEYYGSTVFAIIDDTPGLESPFADIPIFEGYEKFIEYYKSRQFGETGFCITIGNPHGDVRIKSFPALIIIPQLGVGGWAPRPRKERLASTIIAPAIPSV